MNNYHLITNLFILKTYVATLKPLHLVNSINLITINNTVNGYGDGYGNGDGDGN